MTCKHCESKEKFFIVLMIVMCLLGACLAWSQADRIDGVEIQAGVR